MNRVMQAELLAELLAKSRCNCNKSQKYMSMALGKSIGTIQNWENGTATPNLLDTLEWFNILGINPIKFILDFVYPDIYHNLTADNSDQDIQEALVHYITHVSPVSDQRRLAYCMFGNTGSSWSSQLNMLCAHNHTTMRSRVNIAQSIIDNYEMEKHRNELINIDHVMCDEDNLKKAIQLGKEAVYDGNTGYSNEISKK